jgi:hypothetical protein
MQHHLDLIMLADEHRQALVREGTRRRDQQPADDERGRPWIRARLAGALVALALWLDGQEATAGLAAAVAQPHRLHGHA